jgi:hypothetical protein
MPNYWRSFFSFCQKKLRMGKMGTVEALSKPVVLHLSLFFSPHDLHVSPILNLPDP